VRTPKEERLKITVTPNGSTVLVTSDDGGPGAEFVHQALDLDATVYATARTPRDWSHQPDTSARIGKRPRDQVEVISAHDPAQLDRYLLPTATLPQLIPPVTIHRKEAIMPLVYVTLAEGTTSQDQRAQIGDGIYRALIDIANVPEDDRFQVINEVPSTNLIYSPDYMGFDRSPSVVFIQIFFNAGRSVDVKQALYTRIAENLGAAGVRGDDIVINLVEVPKENWSFGRGQLSYPPAPPGSTQ
jgi:4-oxalocrotonate tautomerase